MSTFSDIVEAFTDATLETMADEIEHFLEEHDSVSVKNFASAVKAELTRREGDE